MLSSTMFLMSSLLFLSICYPLMADLEAACDDGWFGDSCKLQCHCKISSVCDIETGSCPVGEPCAPSYFGPGCQYVNWAFTDSDKRTPAFLRDEDVKTCNDNPSATSVTLTFGTPHRVIWFRMLLNEESKFQRFLVTLTNSENLCQNMETFNVDNYMVDVVCGGEVLADTVTIEGEMAAHVCSIIVSGGRNVALKQVTDQVSNFLAYPYGDSFKAVDGLLTPDRRLCIYTGANYFGGWWKVTFHTPYVLHRVVIYSNNVSMDVMSFFKLVTYSESNIQVNEFKNPGTVQPVYYVNLSAGIAVKELKIDKHKLGPSVNDRFFNFCEVQAYSHALCPTGTFGFNCKQSCALCLNESKCSSFTGDCLVKCPGRPIGTKCDGNDCPAKTYGMLCEHNCSSLCVDGLCDRVTGKCLNCPGQFVGQRCEECRDGFFGESCEKPCPELCADHYCEKSLGICVFCHEPRSGPFCDDCPDRKYGVNCSSDCPSTCPLCHHLSGQCFTCKGNFTGPTCKDCVKTVYGDKCELPCPEFCMNRDCHSATGNCRKCAGHRSGTKCNECPQFRYGGADCANYCSEFCQGKQCYTNGSCISCVGKRKGPKCDECPEGRFGTDCHQTCPEKCASQICNSMSGDCLQCTGDHVGPRCQGCPNRRYGPNCTIDCPFKCHDAQCDSITGACFRCIKGFTGVECSEGAEIDKKNKWLLLLILLLIIPIIVISLYCIQRKAGKSPDSEETRTDKVTLGMKALKWTTELTSLEVY